MSQKRPGMPTIDIKSGLTEAELRRILALKGSEIPYQLQLEDMPSRSSAYYGEQRESLSRQLERERILEELGR